MAVKQNDPMEEQKKFNRKINYLVMRRVWRYFVKKKKKRADYGNVYEAFGFTRERYTRVMDSGAVRCSGNELNELNEQTGISKEIFTGETRFFSTPIKEVKITEENWKNLFEKRHAYQKVNDADMTPAEREQKHKDLLNEYKKYENFIFKGIEDIVDKHEPCGDPEFEKFCYFLKHRSAAPAMGVPQIMAIAQKELSKLDFNVLSNYEKDSDLERFAQMLREKAKILQTIVDYHKIAKRN